MRSFRAIALVAALAAPFTIRGDEAGATAPPPNPQTQSQPSSAPQRIDVSQPAPTGQWVYTQQYGWVWMPYGPAYTYVAPGYDYPYTYVWQVGIGWSWVASPWVYGWGPWPYFGLAGPYAFAWYDWGWWRYAPAYPRYPRGPVPPYRPGYRTAAPASGSGGAYVPGGVAPAPRGATGSSATTAPAPRASGGGYTPRGRR